MPYTINRYNGQVQATVADGTIDSSTDLKIIGKNYAGYGEVQNENFLFLLENFANNTQPPRPISGQIWFDTGSSKLKFYDGGKFRTTGGAEISDQQPTGLTVGDFWYDTTNKQLWACDGGTDFTLIGPQGVAGQGLTQMVSRSVLDTTAQPHAIIEAIVDGTTIFIISADTPFTLGSGNVIPGFTDIQQGVTLVYTDDSQHSGETYQTHRFWGTATNSEKLEGHSASEFILSGAAEFSTVVKFSDYGFTVGDNPRLAVFIEDGNLPVINNQLSDTISFRTYDSATTSTKTPLVLKGIDILPGATEITNLGSSLLKFSTVYANTFTGTSSQADALKVGTEYWVANKLSVAGTVVVRTDTPDSINGVTIPAGSIRGEYFVGIATSANYADLAEKYLADADYEPGTVVVVGGEKEVTASSDGQRSIGVVSTNPAYMMNSELEGGTYIALKGRVPVKVSGPVSKGDQMIPSANGTAVAWNSGSTNVFAIALETNTVDGVKLVECVIL